MRFLLFALCVHRVLFSSHATGIRVYVYCVLCSQKPSVCDKLQVAFYCYSILMVVTDSLFMEYSIAFWIALHTDELWKKLCANPTRTLNSYISIDQLINNHETNAMVKHTPNGGKCIVGFWSFECQRSRNWVMLSCKWEFLFTWMACSWWFCPIGNRHGCNVRQNDRA